MHTTARYGICFAMLLLAVFAFPISAKALASNFVVGCDVMAAGMYHKVDGMNGVNLTMGLYTGGIGAASNLEYLRNNFTWSDAYNALNSGKGPSISSGCAGYGTLGVNYYAVVFAFADKTAVENFLYTGVSTTADYEVYPAGSQGIDWGAITPVAQIDWTAVQYVATSSSLFANGTTTLEAIAAQCDDSSNVFSRGLCYAGAFLFVPNPATLNEFFAIPGTAAEKFPFSWMYGVKTEFEALAASSSQNMINSQFNLAQLGIGSTSPMGNLLPDFSGFSSTTITAYIGVNMWNFFQLLIAAALWLGLIVHVYHFARGLAV